MNQTKLLSDAMYYESGQVIFHTGSEFLKILRFHIEQFMEFRSYLQYNHLSDAMYYCKPANDSVRENIAILAWQAWRYIIQHAIIGKLLTLAGYWTLYYPASYLSKARKSLYFTVAIIKRYTVYYLPTRCV